MSDTETLPSLGISEASVYVTGLDAAEVWYRRVLRMETVGKGLADEHDSFRFLRADDDAPLRQRVVLFVAHRTPEQASRPATAWPSGDRSISFRDLDGNSLEIYGQRLFEIYEQG